MDYDLQFARVAMARAVGKRLYKASFENYLVNDDSEQLVQALKQYCSDIAARVDAGDGIALVGNCGTGKDHLLHSCAVKAFEAGKAVKWIFGEDLYQQFRDNMKREEPELDVIREFVSPPILWISDPLPATGDLTDAQRRWLMRIADARYRRNKPIWVSANARSYAQFRSMIGHQTADRIVGKTGIAFLCNWISFRTGGSVSDE
jgi:DNA replication protein DnaC